MVAYPSVLFMPCTMDGCTPHNNSALIQVQWVAKYWPGAQVYDGRQSLTGWDMVVFQKAYLTPYTRCYIGGLAEAPPFGANAATPILLIGLLIAWKWPTIGGFFLIITGIYLLVIHAVAEPFLQVFPREWLIFTLPLIATGIIFLLSRKKQYIPTPQHPASG